MELLDFLRTIRSDPNDSTSPPLWAVRDELSKADEEKILDRKNVYYKRRPYAIVLGLPGNRTLSMHDGSGSFTRLIDIVIIQPAREDGQQPTKDTILAVWNEAVAAQWNVTNVAGLMLSNRLTLATEVPPAARNEKPGELEAVLRFRAHYQRHRPKSGMDLDIANKSGPIYNPTW